MKLRNVLLIYLITISFLLPFALKSQAISECSVALVQSREFINLNEINQYSLSIIKLITEENYASFQAEMKGDMLYGSLFDGDFAAFAQQRRSFMSNHSYRKQDNEARHIIQSRVPDYVISAWENCMLGREGLNSVTVRSNDYSSTIKVFWRAPSGFPRNGSLNIGADNIQTTNVKNKEEVISQLKKIANNGAKEILLVPINTCVPMNVTINGSPGSYGTSIEIPARDTERCNPLQTYVVALGVGNHSSAPTCEYIEVVLFGDKRAVKGRIDGSFLAASGISTFRFEGPNIGELASVGFQLVKNTNCNNAPVNDWQCSSIQVSGLGKATETKAVDFWVGDSYGTGRPLHHLEPMHWIGN